MKTEKRFPDDESQRPRSSFFQSIGQENAESSDSPEEPDALWDALTGEAAADGDDSAEAYADDEFEADDYAPDPAEWNADADFADEAEGALFDDSPAASTSGASARSRTGNRAGNRTGRTASRRARVDSTAKSGLAAPCGWLFLLAGIGWTVAGSVGAIPDQAALVPLQAALPVAGVVLILFGSLRRQLAKSTETWLAQEDVQDERFAELAQQLESTGQTGSSDETQAELLDHSQRTLLALERQDEKIANLTRATRMYGKPLIEISKQLDQVTQQMADVLGLGERINELQTTLETTATDPAAVAGLDEDSAGRLAETLAAAKRGARAAESLESALEDSLSRHWTDGRKQLTGSVESTVENAVAKLEQAMQSGLAELPNQLPTPPQPSAPVDLEPLQQAIDSVAREVAGVATRLARIEAQPASAPMATQASASQGATSAQPMSPQSAEAPAAESGGKAPDASGLAHKIAGERKAKSGNVLGAIAKLRSMKN